MPKTHPPHPAMIVDRKAILSVRTKLRKLAKDRKLEITGKERKEILALIREGERKLFPSQISVDDYHAALDEVAITDPKKQPERWNHLFEIIDEFENQWCK